MKNGANEFGVSLISFWIAVTLMVLIPEKLNLIVLIGFGVAITCGLLADKCKQLF